MMAQIASDCVNGRDHLMRRDGPSEQVGAVGLGAVVRQRADVALDLTAQSEVNRAIWCAWTRIASKFRGFEDCPRCGEGEPHLGVGLDEEAAEGRPLGPDLVSFVCPHRTRRHNTR